MHPTPHLRRACPTLLLTTLTLLFASAETAQSQNILFDDFEAMASNGISADPSQEGNSGWMDVTEVYNAASGAQGNNNARSDQVGNASPRGMRVRSSTGAATLDIPMALTTLGASSVTISFDLKEHTAGYLLGLYYADNASFTNPVLLDIYDGLEPNGLGGQSPDSNLDTWQTRSYTITDGGVTFSDDAYFMIGRLARQSNNTYQTDPSDSGTTVTVPFANSTFHVFDNIRIDVETFVTTFIDEDDGNLNPLTGAGTSLREAINYSPVGAIIKFDLSLDGETIMLGGSQLTIGKDLTIDASALPQGLFIDAGQQSRVIEIPIAGTVITLNSLTITNGLVTGFGEASRGGGIRNYGSDLTLLNSSILNNTAGEGGGIRSTTFNDPGVVSTLTLQNCTVSGNIADYGAGMSIADQGSQGLVQSSTISDNSAGIQAGGIFHYFNSILTLENSIVARNTAGSNADIYNVGTVIPLSANLIGDHASVESEFPLALPLVGQAGNLADPLLASLGWYGGPTQTMLPLQGSPAIDAAGNTGPGGTDQRGFDRFVNGALDIGAIETGNAIPLPGTTIVNLSNFTLPNGPAMPIVFEFPLDGGCWAVGTYLGSIEEPLVELGLFNQNGSTGGPFGPSGFPFTSPPGFIDSSVTDAATSFDGSDPFTGLPIVVLVGNGPDLGSSYEFLAFETGENWKPVTVSGGVENISLTAFLRFNGMFKEYQEGVGPFAVFNGGMALSILEIASAGISLTSITAYPAGGNQGGIVINILDMNGSPIAGAGWRLPTDVSSRSSGSILLGLTPGAYPIEIFLPNGNGLPVITEDLLSPLVSAGSIGNYTVVVDNSVLEISSIVHNGNSITLTWTSLLDAYYTIQFSQTLLEPSWIDVDSMSGSDLESLYQDTDPGRLSSGSGFYRVRRD